LETCVVNSHNEWDKLEEVIVGDGFPSTLPALDFTFQMFFHDNLHGQELRGVYRDKNAYIKQKYVEEMSEDVEGFVELLESHGITVKRPKVPQKVEHTKTPNWKSTNFHALNVRDLTMVVGNEIIETPPETRFRYFENDYVKHLYMDYFKRGAKWTVAPRPLILDSSFDMSWVLREDMDGGIREWYESLKDTPDELAYGYEMMFDAAQCLRFGKDIIFNSVTENHELGVQWLQRHLGNEYRVHSVQLCDSHIDSTIIPLRPGLLLVDWHHFKDINQLPEPLRGWDIVSAPENPNRTRDYDGKDLVLTSTSIDINVLSIDQNTVICHDEYWEHLQPLLKPYGIECIPCRLRHSEIFSGAFHCLTLDVRRQSKLENYFD
jgi:glycine amidinotransferase